jgi:beta-lactamase regulating signal transducer with metallopeptidase domain
MMETLRAVPVDALLLILARVTAVALIGRLMLAAMTRAAASTRYLVAVTTFCSMLAVPLISAAGLQWRLAWLPAPKVATAERAKVEMVDAPGSASLNLRAASAGISSPDGWRGWILPAVLAVAVLFAARMLFGIIAIRWITARAREIDDDKLVRDFDVAGRQLGVERLVRLLASEHVSVPMVWGIRQPVLLLPAAALQWSRERLRVVFAHELAHLRRGDAITLLLTRGIAALYWFHPLAWSLDRAARRDCEQACDDLVLASGTRPSDYADHLLGIARSLPPRDPFGAVTLAMSRRSQLEGRLLSILQPDARRGGVSRRAAAIAAVVAALLVLPVAAIRLTAQPAPDEERHKIAAAQAARMSDDFYDSGKKLLGERDLPGAIDAFTQAIRLEPFAGSAWYNLACAQALSGDQRRALDTLELALLHNFGGDSEKILNDPDLESLHGNRLNELAHLADDLELKNTGKEWQDAIPRYERIARAHPNIARAWFNYGFALAEGGQPRAAIDVFNRVLSMDYRPGTVMYNLGCANALAGDRSSAINWLMRAASSGFDVGGYAKGDRDLDNVRDDRWLSEKIGEARRKHDREKQKDEKQKDMEK